MDAPRRQRCRTRLGRAALRAAAALILAATATGAAALDVSPLWNFDDPAASERAFRAALAATASRDERLVLRTQIARTWSLRDRFAEAHAELDAIEPELSAAGAEPRVRFLLERGRTFRSAGQVGRARPLFVEAAAQATAARLDDLAIDALHMMALVEPDPAAALAWNEKALAAARASSDPLARRWQASLLNNIGWTRFEAGRPADALAAFQAAVDERRRLGNPARLHEARWAVARALRTLGRRDEALALLEELDRTDPPDAHVAQEIGENLIEAGRADDAKPWFAKAHRAFAAAPADDRPGEHEMARLERLSR